VDFVRIGAGVRAVARTRGRDDRPAELTREPERHRVPRDAYANRLPGRLNELGHFSRRFEDEAVRTGQVLFEDPIDVIVDDRIARRVAEVMAHESKLLRAIHALDLIESIDCLL